MVATELLGSPKAQYVRLYCARGEAENRIKEAQLGLFGGRASGLTAEGAIRLSDCVPVFPAGELRHG